MSELLLKEADPGEFGEILALANAMREAIANLPGFNWEDPQTLGKAITAAGIFAGMMFGQVIAAGLATDRDRRRAGEMMLRNFRSGIDPGKRQAARASASLGGGALVQ